MTTKNANMTGDENGISRRAILQKIGSAGFGTAAIGAVSGQGSADIAYDPNRERPYTAFLKNVSTNNGNIKRKKIQKTIPRDEWIRRYTAIDLRNTIAENLRQSKRIASLDQITVGFVQTEESPTDFGVEVEYQVEQLPNGTQKKPDVSIETLRSILPHSGTGSLSDTDAQYKRQNIPVHVSKRTNSRICTYYGNDYETVPGGSMIRNSDSTKFSTLNTAFHANKFNENGWITAAHAVDSNRQPLYHRSSSDRLGIVRQRSLSSDIDICFVRRDSNEYSSATVTSPDGSDKQYPVGGIVTDAELNNHVGDSSYETWTQGRTTCRTSGEIVKTLGFWGGTSAVVTTQSVDNGDSGGPLFVKRTNEYGTTEAFMAGNVFAKTSGGNCKSTTAETTENKLDGYFY